MQETKIYTDSKISQWLKREIFLKKLISPGGIAIMVLFAIGLGFLFTDRDFILLPFLLMGVFLGIILIYYCLLKPLTAFYILTTFAFLAAYPNHIIGVDLPISTGIEVLVVFVYIGAYIYTKKNAAAKGGLISTPISVILIIYTAYLFCEAFNPNISNLVGWFFTIKRFIIYLLIYVLAYDLIDTPEKFRYFLKYWIWFSFAAGLYGCYQQWFGYLPMELNYIRKSPLEYKLLFQGGTLRKFSFLSDVVTFGILAGSMSILTMILAFNEKQKKRKRMFWFFTVILFLGMLYSGTRTTYFMMPAGISLYILLTLQNKKTLVMLFASFMIVFLVMFLPVNSGPLNRFRSAFNTKDESLNVRDMNRHYIQPYIYQHPFGGGVSTTGEEGKRFYPTHPLAGFPPDSGYLKVALEQGWLGFILTIIYNMIILYQGVRYYFLMKNKEYKILMAGVTATLFSIIVTQYAQVSIRQLPQAIFIFSALSLMKRLMEFDEAETELSIAKISSSNEEMQLTGE